MTFAETSGSAAYQKGLMLRASMSMAWAFMALRRVWTSSIRSHGCGLTPMTALASRTPTWACMSMTRAFLPLTVARRRATGPGVALVMVGLPPILACAFYGATHPLPTLSREGLMAQVSGVR